VSAAQIASESGPRRRRPWLVGAGLVVIVIAAVKLVLQLFAARNYGYLNDELYYLACARHLAWGYVDQPPLIAFVTRLVRASLGDSLAAIRLLPALSGTARILLTGLITRELGGGRFAQGLAALCVLLAPGLLALDHFLTMNTFEPLFWMGCAWLVIRMIRTGNTKLWLWFGLLAGAGIENKYSMAMFGFGVVVGLLLTEHRRLLRTKWLWMGGAVAFLLFLPNLLWNMHYGFPFLELQENIRKAGRNVALPPAKFLLEEALTMLPLTVPVWLGGLCFFFARPQGKPFRFLGWACVVTAVTIMALDPRVYYLFPAFPILFAGGGVLWEQWLGAPRLGWVKPAYGALMVLAGALLAPTLIPLLPPGTYIRYAASTHLQQPRIENYDLGPLPQLFADQFGWPEMAATVAGVYNSLSPDVRARTAIFAENYGEAGAIDLFGPRYRLPPAISGHQNYFLWGPRGYTGESIIVMGRNEALTSQCNSVRKMAHVSQPYAMPRENLDVFYCEGLKQPLTQLWSRLKNWN
jgi:Dolichyl-phosphate-mannose-protein mannosyltransferase